MTAKQDVKEYKVKLSGGGLSLDRQISEEVAREIVALVMGGQVGGAGSGAGRAGMGVTGGTRGGADLNPKDFMKAKKPMSDVERITCLAYYLTHNRSTPAFKTVELTALNTEASQPRLSNATVAARNATQKDYLTLAGSGKKKITTKGEAVVEALPDRAAVKAAVEANPLRRRRRGRKRGIGKKKRVKSE